MAISENIYYKSPAVHISLGLIYSIIIKPLMSTCTADISHIVIIVIDSLLKSELESSHACIKT